MPIAKIQSGIKPFAPAVFKPDHGIVTDRGRISQFLFMVTEILDGDLVKKIPNSNIQIPNKFQNPNFNNENVFSLEFVISVIGNYLEFAFWELIFYLFDI